MIRVKCCNNCKYLHSTNSVNKLCIVKCIGVDVDNVCDNHIQKDIMQELEEGIEIQK